jgi:hypothetical protein
LLCFLFGSLAWAADLLFIDSFAASEYTIADNMGLSITKIPPGDLYNKDVNYFKSFKAIIIGDPTDQGRTWDPTLLEPLVNTRQIWSQAITGNIIVLGSDPGDPNHVLYGHSEPLVRNSIYFVTSNKGTGLYLALSEYYNSAGLTSLSLLDQFGQFTLRGANCYEKAHIVGSYHPAMKDLTDADLSNWICSIHEVFTEYPQNFNPLAIAQDLGGDGNTDYCDGSSGVPYILATNGTGPTIKCPLCDPRPGYNKCDITTSCTPTPYGTMCLTRPGYKADGATNTDTTKHWRLNWNVAGHEHRVAVDPGTPSNTLCDNYWAGPDACNEVAIADCGDL